MAWRQPLCALIWGGQTGAERQTRGKEGGTSMLRAQALHLLRRPGLDLRTCPQDGRDEDIPCGRVLRALRRKAAATRGGRYLRGWRPSIGLPSPGYLAKAGRGGRPEPAQVPAHGNQHRAPGLVASVGRPGRRVMGNNGVQLPVTDHKDGRLVRTASLCPWVSRPAGGFQASGDESSISRWRR